MKKILTFLIFSIFCYLSKAVTVSPDSTVCPPTSNIETFVTGTTVYVFIRFTKTKPSDYDVQYKSDSTEVTIWQSVNSANSNNDSMITVIGSLQSCSNYILRFRAKCSDGEYSEWQTLRFKTGGCFPPCTPITDVKFMNYDTTIIMDSIIKVVFYANFTGRSKVYVETKIDNSSNALWVKNNSPQYNLITGLKICQGYSARIISSCDSNPLKLDTTPVYHFSTSCFTNYSCVTPTLDEQITGNFQYNLNDDEIGKYEMQFKPATEINWKEAYTTSIYAATKRSGTLPFKNFGDLKPCTNYTARVRALCLSGNSDWISLDFKTNGCQPLCQKIDSVKFNFSDSISNDGTKVLWVYPEVYGGNWVRNIEYRLENTQNWITTYYNSGLRYCSNYDVRIIRLCNNSNEEVISDTSQIYKLRTPEVNCFRHGGLNGFKSATALSGISIKPNPSSNEPTVSFQLTTATAHVFIKVLNSVGSVVLNTDLGNLSAGDYYQSLIETGALTTGFYFITVQADNELPTMVLWVKL